MDWKRDCFCQETGQSAPVDNAALLGQDAAPQNAPDNAATPPAPDATPQAPLCADAVNALDAPDNAGRLAAPGQGGNVSTTPPQGTTGQAPATALSIVGNVASMGAPAAPVAGQDAAPLKGEALAATLKLIASLPLTKAEKVEAVRRLLER